MTLVIKWFSGSQYPESLRIDEDLREKEDDEEEDLDGGLGSISSDEDDEEIKTRNIYGNLLPYKN
jgi:hypothetical protein